MRNDIKVGFCVAYDWHFLEHSLPLIYKGSDLICLAVDANAKTWSGNFFDFDNEGFLSLVRRIDVHNKIHIYRDNFYVPELTPMQNEVRQRNLMADFMGEGGWHIQLDSDEYFLRFDEFVVFLRSLSPEKTLKTNICCAWITLFKKVENGYLYIHPENSENIEFIQVATREPNYEYGRRNGNFNIHTNYRLLHQSWARSEKEILSKVQNWGHSRDFNAEKYFEFWRSLDGRNFRDVRNLHFLIPEAWPSLRMATGLDISQMIDQAEFSEFPSLTSMQLFFKNSITFSRLRAVRDKIVKSLAGLKKGKQG